MLRYSARSLFLARRSLPRSFGLPRRSSSSLPHDLVGPTTTSLTPSETDLKCKLEDRFPGGQIEVSDISGGCGTFFSLTITHPEFGGLSTIKQHRLVNDALRDDIANWHGLQIKTRPS